MKKMIGFVAACVTVCALMTGCKDECIRVYQGYNANIVAMKDTGVLYYHRYHMMAPYISENGKFCKLVDGKIVEIDDEKEVKNNGN